VANAVAHQVYIGVGSNVGDRKENFFEALARLAKLPDTRILKESSLYESEPLGDSKDWYVNGVIEIETKFKPDMLLDKFKNIERAMGRKKVKKRWGARIIDLDILLYDAQVVKKKKPAHSPSRNGQSQVRPGAAQRDRAAGHPPGARRDDLRVINQRQRREEGSSLSFMNFHPGFRPWS
jgi:2-amino-4-hydroxy-6-hydroxymethyldihydropteridine diphosphokinase